MGNEQKSSITLLETGGGRGIFECLLRQMALAELLRVTVLRKQGLRHILPAAP